MLPLDEYKNKLKSAFTEENDEQRPELSVKIALGNEAKMYISRIYENGAEQVLDEILRDSPEMGAQIPSPDENTHNKIQVDDNIIYWSKSGAEPFVGVFKVGEDEANVSRQTGYGDKQMENQIKNIDREAVENASYFLLRGFDESTVGNVINHACEQCFETEEAISMVRDLIKEDPRLSAYALDEEEEDIYNSYRHDLRKKFLGNSNVINPAMYELDLGMDQTMSTEQPGMDPETQTKIAELQSEIAAREAAHAKEMEQLNKELESLQGEGSLFEKTDPNKGSQTAGFRHKGGPQALANAISQMEWNGPGSPFDLFLNEITVDGYNMLGTAATGQQPEVSQPEQPVPGEELMSEPAPEVPAQEPSFEEPDEMDLSAL